MNRWWPGLRALFLLLCVSPIAGGADDPGSKFWSVWHTPCPVVASTSAANESGEAEPVAQLKKGDRVAGLRYFKTAGGREWIATRREGQLVYVPFTWLTFVAVENRLPGNLPFGGERVDRWHGLPEAYQPDDLVTLPPHPSIPQAVVLRNAGV